MPGLDPQIVEHRIPTRPECPLVRQKLRRTCPDMALKIKGEVQKQIDAGFHMTVEYPNGLLILYLYRRKMERSGCASIIEI